MIRIRRQFVVYFCLHKGQFAERCKLVRLLVPVRPHRRRRFCVLITRFLRTSSGRGRRAPAMRSVLSPIIAAIRALKSSVVSTRSRFIASPSCYRMDRMRCCGYLLASFGAGGGNDFFEARIAAERIPSRRHFSGRRNSARTNRSENAVQFPVTAKLTPSHPPDQPATALGDGDFVNCAALARQRSHRSSLRADKFLEARIVANGIEIRIDPQHSRRQGIRIRHA